MPECGGMCGGFCAECLATVVGDKCSHLKPDGTLVTKCHQMLSGDIWEKCMRCAKTWTKGDGPSSEVYVSQESVWNKSGVHGGTGFFVRPKMGMSWGPWEFQSWKNIGSTMRPTSIAEAVALLKGWTQHIGSLYALVQCSMCHKFHPSTGTDGWVGDICESCEASEVPKIKCAKCGTYTQNFENVPPLCDKCKMNKQIGEAAKKPIGTKGEVRKLPKVNSPMWTDQWSVTGSAKEPYIVSHKTSGNNGGNVTEDGWACSCMAFTRNTPREDCKHILKVKLFEGTPLVVKGLVTGGVNHSKEYAEFLKKKAKQARAETVEDAAAVKMVGDATGRKFR